MTRCREGGALREWEREERELQLPRALRDAPEIHGVYTSRRASSNSCSLSGWVGGEEEEEGREEEGGGGAGGGRRGFAGIHLQLWFPKKVFFSYATKRVLFS
jgi:hypothetical protein